MSTDGTLRRNLDAHGLGAFADRILARECPAIAILLGEEDPESAGASRIGGIPDLPASIRWPETSKREAMDFALQIDLADLPDIGGPLPPAGMLYVFFGRDEPATDVEHRVILHAGGEPLRAASPPAGLPFANTPFAEIPPYRLDFAAVPDFPRWATRDHDDIVRGMSEDQADAYREDFIWSLEPNDGRPIVGKLLGHAAGIGHDPREDAHVVREVDPKLLHKYGERARLDMNRARSWRHFLTLDSCLALDLEIWDAGYLQVLVPEPDLSSLDFSRTYAAVESS